MPNPSEFAAFLVNKLNWQDAYTYASSRYVYAENSTDYVFWEGVLLNLEGARLKQEVSDVQ